MNKESVLMVRQQVQLGPEIKMMMIKQLVRQEGTNRCRNERTIRTGAHVVVGASDMWVEICNKVIPEDSSDCIKYSSRRERRINSGERVPQTRQSIKVEVSSCVVRRDGMI